MYWAVQNTPRSHLLGIVLCIKCFKIKFSLKIPKIGFVNFKIVFHKMQFFCSQFQNTLTQPFLHFLVYLFFFLMSVKQSSTTYLTISKFTFADLRSLFTERIASGHTVHCLGHDSISGRAIGPFFSMFI